jgi:hypothetical protein
MILFDKHHIIWDAISKYVFIKVFMSLYNNETLPETSLQYVDYAVWQEEIRKNNLLKKQEEFWLNQFKDRIPVLNFPTDFPRTGINSQKGDLVVVETCNELTKSIYVLAREYETTVYSILIASLYILLAKYSNQDDIIIGSVVLGRENKKFEDVIGMFVNTLSLRNYPEADKKVSDFLKEVKKNVLEVFENQEFQFDDLVDKLDIKRNLNRNNLFDVMFVFQNIKMSVIDNIEEYNYENTAVMFDLILEAFELENTINFKFRYCIDLFERKTIERMSKDYLKILETIVHNKDILIKQIKLETNFIKKESTISEKIEFVY